MMGDMWDDCRIEKLRKLWSESHSTAEIGRLMGLSKNAVVGKAHRLGLPGRPSPIRGHVTSRRPRVLRTTGATLVALSSVIAIAPHVEPARVVEPPLKRTCQWIDGDTRVPGWSMCGKPCTGSWCADHRKRVFGPAPGGAAPSTG